MILLGTSGDLFSCEKMKMTPVTIWSLKQFNLVVLFFFFPFLPFPLSVLEINIKILSG